MPTSITQTPRAWSTRSSPLAIRLQFDFAARMSEVLELQWEWIDFAHRRVVWPDSKTGGMSKPLSAEAALLLRAAPRYAGSKFVIPALFDGSKPMSKHTYWAGWRRILERAGLPHCGTHAVRHRAATDIANSGVPVKVGMALTAHKTVTMFMRYVHTEDDPIRQAAETVASRRRIVVQGTASTAEGGLDNKQPEDPAAAAAATAPRAVKAIVDRRSASTGLGNYRPYRNRKGQNRPSPAEVRPPGSSGRGGRACLTAAIRKAAGHRWKSCVVRRKSTTRA